MDKPNRTRKAKLKRALAIAGIGAAAVIDLLAIDYYAYPYGRKPGGRSFNRGENGLWLRYKWYFGEHSGAETDAMIGRLHDYQFKYAYFHVRSVGKSGMLQHRYGENARNLNQVVHEKAPSVQSIAWIYAGNAAGRGDVNIANPEIRRKMVAEAVWLTTECGFDGIQWDYEICPDGDTGLLALLRETRAALPAGKLISVATPMWMPWPVSHWGWSEEYIGRVAKLSDQIAVMCYDSAFNLPRSYVWLVEQQAVHYTDAVNKANSHCRLLLGVPTYGPAGLSHNPTAENIEFALRGLRQGLGASRSAKDVFAGVAIFADYTTEEAEWQTYRRLWLGDQDSNLG